MAKTKNDVLQRAKDNKNDEFYTRMVDIEKEMPLHFDDFKDKTIYCCCDDYRWSNFILYFKDHFVESGIKKLIATNYDNGDGAWKYVYDGKEETITALEGNGDFMSEECTAIKDNEADIIITNPPFSKFKSFIHWLYGNDGLFKSKPIDFLVIGNKNAGQWQTIFPLYFEDKLRWGYNCINKFQVPDGSIADLEGMGRWFTTLPVNKNNPPIKLVEFDTERHKKYDTFDAVNTNSIKDIPDIDGLIGVPIGILDYICKDQFEIVGMLRVGCCCYDFGHPIIDGKHLLTRIVIKKKK